MTFYSMTSENRISCYEIVTNRRISRKQRKMTYSLKEKFILSLLLQKNLMCRTKLLEDLNAEIFQKMFQCSCCRSKLYLSCSLAQKPAQYSCRLIEMTLALRKFCDLNRFLSQIKVSHKQSKGLQQLLNGVYLLYKIYASKK